jgi:hypothetical protein
MGTRQNRVRIWRGLDRGERLAFLIVILGVIYFCGTSFTFPANDVNDLELYTLVAFDVFYEMQSMTTTNVTVIFSLTLALSLKKRHIEK